MSLLNRISSIINDCNLSNEIKDFVHTDTDMKDDLIDSETPPPSLPVSYTHQPLPTNREV